jgi:hypothetical protein
MNYKLHKKASNLMQMHQAMKERIFYLEYTTISLDMFPDLQAKYFNRIDPCKRGLERIEQAYIKVLTEILAV